MRKEGTRDQGHAFARNQLLGHPHRLARIGAVVARDHLKLFAENTAFGVDFLDRHFPTLLVRVEEGGLRLVAVELADLDCVLRRRRRNEPGREETGSRETLHMTLDHDFAPCVAESRATGAGPRVMNPTPVAL